MVGERARYNAHNAIWNDSNGGAPARDGLVVQKKVLGNRWMANEHFDYAFLVSR
jgi:hypothetical protein